MAMERVYRRKAQNTVRAYDAEEEARDSIDVWIFNI